MSFRTNDWCAKRRGFSLAEALAALVLAGVVVPVALRCVSVSLRLGGQSARRSEAMLLAEGKLNELVATGAWEDTELAGDFTHTPSGGILTGQQGEPAVRYRWIAAVTDWLDPTVKELTVAVYWEERGQREEVVLTTLVQSPQ